MSAIFPPGSIEVEHENIQYTSQGVTKRIQLQRQTVIFSDPDDRADVLADLKKILAQPCFYGKLFESPGNITFWWALIPPDFDLSGIDADVSE